MPFVESRNHYIEKVRAHSFVGKGLDHLWETFKARQCVVDLGCGNGHFLADYLELNPEFVGLGVDRRFKRIFKAAEKLQRRSEDSQSRIIFWDVPSFLRDCPAEFWDEVWLQFPDPWPKLKHTKHRMVTQELLMNIFRVLKNGGKFCFRSDCRAYWEFLQIENSRTNLFPIVLSQKGDLFDFAPKTLFQMKFLKTRTPIYSLQFKK